jgi:hypothetical protein
LGYLDEEVINKDIVGCQGLVERTVGRWCYFVRLNWQSLDPRERLENGVDFGFIRGFCPWVPGHTVVVLGRGFFVELVRWSDVVGMDGLICKVAYCFGHDTEGWWRLDPSHGAGERDGNELTFPFEFGENQGET